jgi:phospho-N-acetylmuramoyl-pentapeptide-transferase
MLYHLLYPLADRFIGFNVFRYVTFRSVGAAVTAFLLCLILGPWVIRKLRALSLGERIREDGPRHHESKAGTPSMGGVLILMCILTSSLLWIRWDSKLFWVAVFSALWFGGLGFVDDYMKLLRIGKGRGLPAGYKLGLQSMGAMLIVGAYLTALPEDFPHRMSASFPFIKIPVMLDLLYPFFAVLVIVGASNAVNLTDGLDGLAIGCTAFTCMAFAIITYLVGNVKFSEYLMIINVPGTGELTVFSMAMLGACLGFLWFNAHPAQVFMGDTGSLSLGGLLGVIAVMVKQEVLLVIVGGIFVAEALSVILQVASFKVSGKRIFRMAPLHHHFELLGIPESKLIIRFWIVAIVLTLMTLVTLKLR